MLVLPPASQPMMLLGKVDELEVDAERAQDVRLLRVVESPDRFP